MLYEPPRPDRYLWDTWLLPVPDEGTYHLFHMQKVAGEPDSVEIGHAVSPDLVRWTALDPALTASAPGPSAPAGPWDSVRLRTGTALRHEGRYFLFYGAAPDHVDRVGVATSTDLRHWQRHPQNPVAVPDARWYEHDHATCPIGNVAWRDPCIRRAGDGWIMYLTARLTQGPESERATVATLRSRDLLRWEVGPPLDVPAGFVAMEVPDVFELDGRWFLLHSTSHRMGAPFPTCDPGLTAGTFVLWAERPEGPYARPARDVLVGGPAERMTAYVCRTVETPPGRIAYYHNVYPQPRGSRARRGSFALPKGLAVDDRGLLLRYLPVLEPYLGPELLPPLDPPMLAGDARLPLEGAGARDVMLTAVVTVEAGRSAGVAFRTGPDGGGLGVLLDAARGRVSVVTIPEGSPPGEDLEAPGRVLAGRRAAVRPGVPVFVRVVLARCVVDVFLDEELALSVVAEGVDGAGLALLACDARIRIDSLRARRLALPEPRYAGAA
jgi:beta-fructofuranosidase